MITDSVKTINYLSLRCLLTKYIGQEMHRLISMFAGVLQAMVFEKLSILLKAIFLRSA